MKINIDRNIDYTSLYKFYIGIPVEDTEFYPEYFYCYNDKYRHYTLREFIIRFNSDIDFKKIMVNYRNNLTHKMLSEMDNNIFELC